MGIVRGLANLEDELDRPTSSGESVSGRWLSLADGQSAKIRFLQELDPDSPTYDDRAGLGFIAVEHSHPKDYRRKALCSIDDQGRCFGCEMYKRDPDKKSGWKSKRRLYINVLVEDEKEGPYVAILSQGLGPKSATPEIIQFASETGSITNVTWRLKRTGEKTDTNYSIIPLPTADMKPIDYDNLELIDLEKAAVRDVPYADQERFYTGITDDSSEESHTSSSVEW